MVDIRGACKYLKCPKSTINCLCREGSLSFDIDEDGKRVFSVQDLKQLRHVHPLLSLERFEREFLEQDRNPQLELDEDDGPLY